MRYKIATVLIALFLTATFFKDVAPNQFLFLHDEFLLLSKNETDLAFFARNPSDFGVANTTLLIVTYFDKLYYYLVHNYNLDLLFSQKLLFFIKIVLLIHLSFSGFKRLALLFKTKGLRDNNFAIYLIALWFSFNTYTLIYFNGNGFSLTLLLCYALSPLAFYYFHESVFGIKGLLPKLKFVLTAFVMSFALPLFFVFVILTALYTILYAALSKKNLVFTIRSLVAITLLYLPFLSIHILIPYEMFFNSLETVNLEGGETYNLLQGGLLYQYFMWFSWGLYTYWEPRNIFTYHAYYKTALSLMAPFVLYFLILIGFFKSALNKKTASLLLILLVLFIFIKGQQSPFGELYTYMIENVSLFRAFRSPDSKFGFGIVFLLSTLLLSVYSRLNLKLFCGGLLFVIVVQNIPLFTGEVIAGSNGTGSKDRIISVTDEQKDVINFLNSSKDYGYILPLPSVAFGHFSLGNSDSHLGQDLLPKYSELPFVYVNEFSGMLSDTYDDMATAVKQEDASAFKKYPIKFVLVRKDIENLEITQTFTSNISSSYTLVYENPYYKVYENPDFVSLVSLENADVEMISPVEYRLSIKDLKDDRDFIFRQNYNPAWKIYSAEQVGELNTFGAINILRKDPLFEDTHNVYAAFGNAWTLNSNELSGFPQTYQKNADGTIDVDLVLFYKTHSILVFGILITTIYFIILSMLLILVQKPRVINVE